MNNTTPLPPEEERLHHYATTLARLKERQVVREVAERELLHAVMLQNQARLAEFPLLDIQQQSVVNLLSQRSQFSPAHGLVKRVLGQFANLVAQYAALTPGGESPELSACASQLANAEILVAKAVQGTIFCLALIHDNVEETLIESFGESAVAVIADLTQRQEMTEAYWRRLLETFVSQPVAAAYAAITAKQRCRLTNEPQGLAMRFAFDDVLAALTPPEKLLPKTHMQDLFESATSAATCGPVLSALAEVLPQEPEVFQADRDMLVAASRFVCLDPVGEELLTLGQASAPVNDADKELQRRHFVRDQALALIAGALLTLLTVRREFLASLTSLHSREAENVAATLGGFDLAGVLRGWRLLLELEFLAELRRRAEPEGSKILLRTLRQRRLTAAEMTNLEAAGLSRIRRNKLFERSEGGEFFLFTPRSLQELAGLIQVLQLESPLAAKVLEAWERAGAQVEFLVLVNVEQVSKTTTNLKKRLAEILGAFGLGRSA